MTWPSSPLYHAPLTASASVPSRQTTLNFRTEHSAAGQSTLPVIYSHSHNFTSEEYTPIGQFQRQFQLTLLRYDNMSTVPTLQFLFPMGGLGTRFAQIGIATPKPLIHVDGAPMIHKALSSFDELMVMAATMGSNGADGSTPLHIRVVFVVRAEHETQFQLRTQLAQTFASKYGCSEFWCINKDGTDKASKSKLEGIGDGEAAANTTTTTTAASSSTTAATASTTMSVYFVMMHADTSGAAETCLLAEPALVMTAPVVILDCDLYVYSSRLNTVLLSMARRGCATAEADTTGVTASSKQAEADTTTAIPPAILSTLRGALVFFNSKAPRYSYAIVEPIEGLDLSDPKGVLSAGGKVTRTAEKIPISNCSLIGAYTFAAAGWFVAAAKKLVAQPINPDNGMKEYYISLLYNFLLEPSFEPQGFAATAGATATASSDVLVLAVPQEGYASFGTPDELDNYKAGKPSYVLE